MKVSVIIATRNRHDKIGDSLKSILANSFSDFEVIVVDQSSNDLTGREIDDIRSKRIKYFKLSSKGKLKVFNFTLCQTKALNFALRQAKGEIIAFTDDDCLVDKNWLENIYESFKKNKDVVGVFGKVLLFRPEKHKNLICPAVFEADKGRVIDHPEMIFYRDLGIGNNMSFRKSIFSEVGAFKEWLGMGSISMAGGEEGELIYRITKKGYKLFFNPKIVVYHNKWLSSDQERGLQGKYTCGLMAFYFYYLFKKEKIMARFIFERVKEIITGRMSLLLRKIGRLDFLYVYRNKKEFIFLCWELACIIRGFLIAVYFSLSKK